jgi:hypothetical protein
MHLPIERIYPVPATHLQKDISGETSDRSTSLVAWVWSLAKTANKTHSRLDIWFVGLFAEIFTSCASHRT